MRLLANERRMLLIAFCGGLYWASSLLLQMAWKSSAGPEGFLGAGGSMIIPVAAIVIGLLYLFRTVFFQKKFQMFLAFSAIAASILSLLIYSFNLTASPLGFVLELILPGYYHACSIVFWGLNFASLSKDESEKTVFVTLLFTFALYLAGSAVDLGRYCYLISQLMKTLAFLPFMMGLYSLTIEKRDPVPENQKLIPPFVLSRCFFGLAIGVTTSLSIPVGSNVSREFSVAVCILLCCVAVYFFRSESRFGSLLRVMPLLAIGFLILPYAETEGLSEAFYQGSSSIVWISWIIVSSVQLSDLKEKLGWDEARLVLFEKLIVISFWLFAQLIATFLRTTYPDDVYHAFLQYAPSFLAYLVVVVGCYLLSNIIDNKERQRILEKALKLSKDEMKAIYRGISIEYKLTEREEEVFELLANGYNRPYICRTLFISEGTARSHISHIYKKLDIHSREELYEIVNARKHIGGG